MDLGSSSGNLVAHAMASLMRRQATTEGQRPYTIGPQDHRGVVMTLSVLFLLYALMVMGMRYAARARTMGMDDFIVVGATVSRVQVHDVLSLTDHTNSYLPSLNLRHSSVQ